MRFSIVVHGGAGFQAKHGDKLVKNAMKRACIKAAEHLELRQGTVTDAVEVAIRELEDEEGLNAGYGSNLTMDKRVECDASIMRGDGSFGSVAAIEGIKNPISAARAILEGGQDQNPSGRMPPMTLTGRGVVDYVQRASGSQFIKRLPEPLGRPAIVRPEELIAPQAEKDWQYWSSNHVALDIASEQTRNEMGDTVGAIVIAEDGSIAAGVSSGGLLLKYPGRIGEAAVYGAGCWASSSKQTSHEPLSAIACSVSGTGEQIIRGALARKISETCDPSTCDDPVGYLSQVFDRITIFEKTNHPNGREVHAGAITVFLDAISEQEAKVRLIIAFTTPSMSVATFSSGDKAPKALVHRHEGSSVFLTSTLLTTFSKAS